MQPWYITDDQIQACAKTGGVIGINGIGLFLPERQSSTLAMLDCITYVRDLVAVDHVGRRRLPAPAAAAT